MAAQLPSSHEVFDDRTEYSLLVGIMSEGVAVSRGF
jgi:hypothetical protein